jgi:hypothetical protein
MLASTRALHSFDEVCNFNAIDPDKSPVSYFRFRRDAQADDPAIALRPTNEVNTRLIDAYLTHLAAQAKPEKRLLLDIKYGHVHNFEVGWWPSERRPFLAAYLEDRGIKTIHLTRRDSLAAIVSGQIADKTRVWHKRGEGEDQTFPKVRIAAMRAVHEAVALDREKENFRAWLAPHQCFDVEYEELTASDAERNGVMSRLCGFLGIEAPQQFQSTHKKVTPPLSEAVENYDDLIKVARLFGSGRWRFSTH